MPLRIALSITLFRKLLRQLPARLLSIANKDKTSQSRLESQRTVYDWLPVFHLTKDEVWDVIEDAGKAPFHAYGTRDNRLNERLSCVFCMMGSVNDLKLGAQAYPNMYARYIALERFCDHTMFVRTKQKTHYKETVDIITGKTLKQKTHVEKTVIKVPLYEKTGVPYDELRVQHWLNYYREQEQASSTTQDESDKSSTTTKTKTNVHEEQIQLF